MTARELFKYLDEKGMADVPILIQYRDELGDQIGYDVLGKDSWIEIDEDNTEFGTVVML